MARHEPEISTTTDVADHPEFADRRATKVLDGVELTGWWTEDFTLAELRTLRAKERIPDLRPDNTAFDGLYQVPTFQEVIDLAKRAGVGIYPETKHPTYFDSIGLSLEEPLLATLRANGYSGPRAKVFIQSFETGNLKELNRRTRRPAGPAAQRRRRPLRPGGRRRPAHLRRPVHPRGPGRDRHLRRRHRPEQEPDRPPRRRPGTSSTRPPWSTTPTRPACSSTPTPSATRTTSCPPTSARATRPAPSTSAPPATPRPSTGSSSASGSTACSATTPTRRWRAATRFFTNR